MRRRRWAEQVFRAAGGYLFEHDLRANASRLSQGKPLHTFPDHALGPAPLAIGYFFVSEGWVGCHPAPVPFWLGAAAIAFILSFLGFLVSRLLLCWRLAISTSLGLTTRVSGPGRYEGRWVSRSLPSGAYSRDPLARNEVDRPQRTKHLHARTQTTRIKRAQSSRFSRISRTHSAAHVAAGHVGPQQPRDAGGRTSPFLLQGFSVPVERSLILGCHRGHHPPSLTLAVVLPPQHPQQRADVSPLTRGPALAPTDRKRGGIHPLVGDPVSWHTAMPPRAFSIKLPGAGWAVAPSSGSQEPLVSPGYSIRSRPSMRWPPEKIRTEIGSPAAPLTTTS